MNRKSFLKNVALLSALTASSLNAKGKKSTSSAPEKIKPENGGGFDLSPRIFKTGNVEMKISVPEEFKGKIDNLDVSIICGDGGWDDTQKESYGTNNAMRPEYEIVDGAIIVKTRFMRESRYTVIVHEGKFSKKTRYQSSTPQIAFLRAFALKSDLYKLRPRKGDIHIHSTNSDGCNKPVDVALRNYEIGMDFQSISDHRVWQTSEDMRILFSKYPTSMSFYNAEECHHSSVHVHNFGGKASLTDYVNSHKDEFKAIASKYYKTIEGEGITNRMKRTVSSTEAEFEIIRKLGGLAILNHPYWQCNYAKAPHYNMTMQSIDLLCQRKNFDAYEFVNYCCKDISVSMANSKYFELCKNGLNYPVVGATDAHTIHQQGNGYTVVFTKSDNIEDVKDAILKHRSLAVAEYPPAKMVFGEKRYVDFLYFLYDFYFPKHDKLVAEEGKILRKIIEKGESPELIKKLESASKQVEDLYPSLLKMS